MNDVVTIVLSYADTPYRKKLLYECLQSISTPIILSSHYPVDEDVQLMADFVIYDSDNPVLDKSNYSKYGFVHSAYRTNKDGSLDTFELEFEHSFAVYMLIQNGIKLAEGMGKTKVNIINYDYIIPNSIISNHINLMENGYDLVFYSYDNTDIKEYHLSYCTGFFSGTIKSLKNYFYQYRTIDEFYTSSVFTIFEKRVYNFFKNNQKFNVEELDFQQLQSTCSINREGVLFFSKG